MQLLYPKGKRRNKEDSPHVSDLAMEWQQTAYINSDDDKERASVREAQSRIY
jgi:hypothetical protein